MADPTTTSTAPPDEQLAAEQADAAKTADDAPAPVHPAREREVLVRDAIGGDPYVADQFGADGEREVVKLGQPPGEAPDPRVAALRDAKAREDANPVADRTAPPAHAGGRPTDAS